MSNLPVPADGDGSVPAILDRDGQPAACPGGALEILRPPRHPSRRPPQSLPVRARPAALHPRRQDPRDHPRSLLESLDLSQPAGVRDRALFGTLAYTGTRVGAVTNLRLQDLRDLGGFRTLWFREKRGREREIPVRYDLDEWLAAYLAAAGDPGDAPFFRPLTTGRNAFEPRPLQPWTIRAILKRRLKATGLPDIITPHSFRAMVVTDLLSQGVSTEHVQYLVGHARPSTTQLYDRRAKTVTRNIVERISV